MNVGIAPANAGVEPGAPVGWVNDNIPFACMNAPRVCPVNGFVIMHVDIVVDDDGDMLVSDVRRGIPPKRPLPVWPDRDRSG